MAHRRRKRSRRYKNPRRVRSARRAYKRSGLYKYNQRRKRRGGKRRRRHHSRRRAHSRRRRHFKRLSKAEARAARIARKLARSRRHVAVVPVAKLTTHQRSYLSNLRARLEARKELPTSAWAS